MENSEEKKTDGRKRRWWRWPVIIIGIPVVLVVLLLVAATCVLTPSRLTGWTRQYGTAYLDQGRVDVALVDLSIWSTFPHAELTVDSLAVINTRPQVPDTVVALERFHGRVNLAALLIGRIAIDHVELTRPCATYWQGPDSLNSLSILPVSGPKKESSGPLALPDLRINHFEIIGDALLRYVSEPDSISALVTIRQSTLKGSDDVPQYAFNIGGNLGALPFLREHLTYGIDGGIGWSPSKPLALSLHDFKVEVDSLKTVTSLRADFATDIRLDELDFRLEPLPLQRVAELASMVPQLASMVPKMSTEATFALTAHLRKPYVYVPGDSVPAIPDMEITALINDAPIAIPAYYIDFSRFGAELRLELSDKGLDASRAELKHLLVAFPGSEFRLHGSATNLLSDPRLQGCFEGNVNFKGLDPRVWTLLAMRLSGAFSADIDFDLHLSDATPNTFHRALLKGEADLRDFMALLPADSLAAGVTRARLEFGSANRFVRNDVRVDSMLTVSVSVDSAWVLMPELTARLADLKMGVGVENRASSLDTTTVTPMGARLSLRTLRYESAADSSRAMLRGLSGALALARYKGGVREPRLGARLGVERMVFAAGANRVSLRGGEISASAFRSAATERKPRRKLSPADSLRLAARRDSLLLASAQQERIDFGVDRGMVTLLRKWNVSGSLKAAGGRVITPAWPLKTRMRDLNFDFDADSLNLRSLRLTTGQSDFALTGSVNNIQRALGRRNSRQPLRLSLDLTSDTINVNQLVQTAFRGAAADVSTANGAADLDADDATMETEAAGESSTEMKAIVVPMNIDATLNFGARNIIYSTMELHDFAGQVLIANGAANLRDLHAATDIGSAELNMLYYAPTRNDVDFGMSLDLHRFNLGRVTEMMPALDSIMPMLRSFGGVVDAQVSATTRVDSMLNIDFPSLKAMVRLTGDSLVVLDPQTFKTISKWLLFKDKNKNMIDHMDVHLAVEDNVLNLYPFMFDFDRYRLGVMGHNDMNLNLNYHISILKSPIPFKFGINVRGTMEKMKIRLGRARFRENMAAQSVALGDTLRLNLAQEIRNVFQRGARAARLAPLKITKPEEMPAIDEKTDTLTPADSLYLRQNGMFETPAQ